MTDYYNPEQFDSICGWCENSFSGPVERKEIDGAMTDLCPDCATSYHECDQCGKSRPGVTLYSLPTNGHDEPESTQVCSDCIGAESDRDEAYERAAARARSNDFEDTDGKDWT